MLGAVRRFLALGAAARRGTASDGLPYKLTLILTRRCPTRCSFCSIWKTPSPDELSVEEWDRVLASVPGAVWVNLSGGEILLRPDLDGILDALTSRLPRLFLVDFPTTGYHPERLVSACERLVRAGVPRVLVTISLDGPPELHDRLRGRDGAHEQACTAMRALRRARVRGVRAYFGVTLLPENHAAVEPTIRSAMDRIPGLSARDFHFNLGMESGHYYANEGAAVRPPPEAVEILDRFRRRGLDPVSLVERAYQKRVPEFLRTGRSPVSCAALRASVFVDPQGVVYPCSIYSRPLGSLREHGLDLGAVLRGDSAASARAAVVAERCPGCWTPCEAYQSLFSHYLASNGKKNGITREA